jgi:glycyl-tRNA synthetase beta chain
LDLRQADRVEEVLGPPVSAAFKDGAPTKAAEGFARSQGVPLDRLHRVRNERGEYLAVSRQVVGRPAAEILAEGLPARILALRFPKTMVWGDGSLRFARPIRWLVALLGEQELPLTLGPLRASRASRGHRLLAPGPVLIPAAESYVSALAAAHVQADPVARRQAILAMAREAAAAAGGRLVEDEVLLDTVNFLVEEPAALTGRFPERFLELPREVVATAMKAHQRYFSVEDADGRLAPVFVVILNGARPQPALVREGNERVLQARLADARFYWETDRKLGLEGLAERLAEVLWVEGLGTMAERVERLRRLALAIGQDWPGGGLDREALDWTARHCKADLAGEMIKDGKEFTQLAGLMGQEYARAQGLPDGWARALGEHVLPRFAGDALPESALGTALALADRLDAIAGLWLAGFAPTGSKDPYALRRQAFAVLRILLEKELPFRLDGLLAAAAAGYAQADAAALTAALLEFFLARLRGLMEEEGVAPDIFEAVTAAGETGILDLRARARALNALRGDPAFEQLVIGARRVGNILAKEGRESAAAQALPTLEAWSGGAGPRFGFAPDAQTQDEERQLCVTLAAAAPALLAEARSRDYTAAYRRLADLGAAIDRYFGAVLVNCPDVGLRENRLAFLSNLAHIFLHFARFSSVVLEGERERN